MTVWIVVGWETGDTDEIFSVHSTEHGANTAMAEYRQTDADYGRKHQHYMVQEWDVV